MRKKEDVQRKRSWFCSFMLVNSKKIGSSQYAQVNRKRTAGKGFVCMAPSQRQEVLIIFDARDGVNLDFLTASWNDR